MASLSSLIAALDCVEGGNDENLNGALVKLLSECGDNTDVAADLVSCGILPVLAALVTAAPNCWCKVADLVATLVRAEVARSPAVQAGLVPLLIGILHYEDRGTVRHALRALGNICFDNDEGREAVLRGDGVPIIARILEKESTREETLNADDMNFVKAVCGCVLNMMAGYNAVVEEAIRSDVPASLVQVIRHHGAEDISLCRVLIMALDSLLEGSQEEGADALREAGAVTVIVRLLGAVEDSSVKELIIETISSAAQNELWQLALAAQGCVSHLLRQFNLDVQGPITLNDVSTKVMDLIVMLLTGDESLKILFSDGNGPILPVVLNWLRSEDSKVLSSAALAIGNMARSDENCANLLEKGVVEQLLAILDKHASTEDHVAVLHGVLSALRNLSMPAASKCQLAAKRVFNNVLPLVHHSVHPVQLKSLGALRLMVDGQESVAIEIGSQPEVCERLVELSVNGIDVGVTSEAQRLIAALIKNSKTDSVGNPMLAAGVVKPLAALAESQHVIMVHEAILALNILVLACKEAGVAAIKESGIVKIATDLSNDTENSSELRSNADTLLAALQ